MVDDMTDRDMSGYFAEFAPTAKQLKKLTKLVRSVHERWEVGYGDALDEAVLIVAPGTLAALTPSAYALLRRCQRRVWRFKVHLDDQYRGLYQKTYRELFNQLLSLGLITEGTVRQKIMGWQGVDALRSFLGSRGLLAKGNKDALVERMMHELSPDELSSLVTDVILFVTTPAGEQAIDVINTLSDRMRPAFGKAVAETMEYSQVEDTSVRNLPAGVLYDDGDVRITEEDVQRACCPSNPDISSVASSKVQKIQLTLDTVTNIVNRIKASGDGWLRIQTSDEDDAFFIQVSWHNDYANMQWYFDSNADSSLLLPLGFMQEKDAPLLMKWVQEEQVVHTLIETSKLGLGVGLGTVVSVEYEIVGCGVSDSEPTA